ncbi:MAG: hypothetical protein JO168_20375 [Solirubrobacterales bacterium]|nr:hypothetical protein [Solirubrobacterales bacterium]
MFGDQDSFEEMFRSWARELGESVERAIEHIDVDDIVGSVGVDPLQAREWVQSAGDWLRAQSGPPTRPAKPAAAEDPLSGAVPHPLDLPTEEQGLALAALDSGRWTVEPGTEALAARGDGPGPSDALGLVRELRIRDWIAADGALTLTGRSALARWLEAGAAA